MDITKIPHINEVSAFHGEYNPADCPVKSTERFDDRQKHSRKVLPSLEEAIRRSGLKDGMTIPQLSAALPSAFSAASCSRS